MLIFLLLLPLCAAAATAVSLTHTEVTVGVTADFVGLYENTMAIVSKEDPHGRLMIFEKQDNAWKLALDVKGTAGKSIGARVSSKPNVGERYVAVHGDVVVAMRGSDAIVFTRVGGVWSPTPAVLSNTASIEISSGGIVATNPRDKSVRIINVDEGVMSRDPIVVRAPEDAGGTWFGGNPSSLSGNTLIVPGDRNVSGTLRAGSFIFRRNGNGDWVHKQFIQVETRLRFGKRFSISGDTLVNFDMMARVGGTHNPGGIYIYKEGSDGLWAWDGVLRHAAPKAVANSGFGLAAFVSENIIIVGERKRADSASYIFRRSADGSWPVVPTRINEGAAFTLPMALWKDTYVIGGEVGVLHVYAPRTASGTGTGTGKVGPGTPNQAAKKKEEEEEGPPLIPIIAGVGGVAVLGLFLAKRQVDKKKKEKGTADTGYYAESGAF